MMRCPFTLAFALAAASVAAGFAAPAVAQSAVQPGASWTVDVLSAVVGSPEYGTDVVGRVDAWLDLEGAAIGLDKLSSHIDVMAVHGPDFSGRRVGAYQTISSLEADTLPHVYEAWALWKPNPHVSAKAGLIDLNAEFDIQNTGALFVNSAFGIGPDISQSGLNGPSIFPMTAAAAVLRLQHGRKGLALGVFDALAGSSHDPRKVALRLPGTTGALLIAEARVPLGTWMLQAGAWHYTTRFDALDPARPPAISQGVYGLVEGAITRKVSAWLRVGAADPRANQIAAYFGGGAVATVGNWRLGLAGAHASLGSAARRTLYATDHARQAETVIELTAQRPLAPWLLVQPDLQYVVHPGWNPTARNVLVAGLRFSFALPDS
ncbi:MAG: carbohydrate porin [Novosphingobium sp.]|uniref:carbohydrate porin n=1 Tax=Novosphingobium sp. TaxID=1874826 RepID=UPI0030166BB3